MTRYIAFLRGINVSGQKLIKMNDLKKSLETLPYYNVKTYIQSGNIVFDRDPISRQNIKSEIENSIEKHHGFRTEAFIVTPEHLSQILIDNPFKSNKDFEYQKCYFTFTLEEPGTKEISILDEMGSDTEKIMISSPLIYLYFENGYGRAKLNNNFIERKLRVPCTTRNYNTLNKTLGLTSN